MDYDEFNLDDLKPLTSGQYDRCVANAKKRIQGKIGKKPTYQDFRFGRGGSWWQRMFTADNALNFLALVIFLAAFVMSSMNIILHTGNMATEGYEKMSVNAPENEMAISEDAYITVNQIAFVFLAESAMIVFMVMFALSAVVWYHWRRLPYLVLALMSAVYVVNSNITSGVAPFEAVMPPSFTIGISFFLERIIVNNVKERREIMTKFEAALIKWQAEAKDITRHPDYLPALYREIWEKLVSLKINQGFMEATSEFKRAAVERELARDMWIFDSQSQRPTHVNRLRDSRENYVKSGSTIQNEGKSDRLRELFQAQQEMVEIAWIDPQAIADQMDVSLGLVYKIRKEFGQSFSTNGHTPHE